MNGMSSAEFEEAKDKPRPAIGAILTVPWIRSIMLIGIGIALTQQAYGVIIGMVSSCILLFSTLSY